MLKNLLVLSISICNIGMNAQITITNNQLPTAGTTVIMSNAQNNAGIDFATTGSNQTWDFSSLVYSSQDSWAHNNISSLGFFAQFQFGLLAPTRYKATYYRPTTTLPIAQITSFLPITLDSVYAFTRATIDSSCTIGYGLRVQGNTVGFRSDTIEKNYDLTATFGDTWSSIGKTNFDFNPFVTAKFVQKRTHNSIVDGFGTITTPFGTFNAIRIKHSILERDSLYYRDTIFSLPVDLQVPINIPPNFEYEWRSLTEREAILRIKTSSIAGNEVVRSIEYRDSLHYNVGLESIEAQTFISPNPCSEQLYISCGIQISKITLFDLQGKLILEETPKAFGTTLYVKNLPEGMYITNIETEEGIVKKKIIKN